MKKEVDICKMCRHGVKNYTSVIGTIPWCCEKHWHCKPGSLASDYMPKRDIVDTEVKESEKIISSDEK